MSDTDSDTVEAGIEHLPLGGAVLGSAITSGITSPQRGPLGQVQHTQITLIEDRISEAFQVLSGEGGVVSQATGIRVRGKGQIPVMGTGG